LGQDASSILSGGTDMYSFPQRDGVHGLWTKEKGHQPLKHNYKGP